MRGSNSASIRRVAILAAVLAAGAAVVITRESGITHRRQLLGLITAAYLLVWLLAFGASRIALRELTGRFLLVSASLAVTWAGCEAITLAGLLDARSLFRAHARLPWLEPGNLFDPDLLWRRRPHLRLSGYRRKGNTAEAWNLPPQGPGYRYDLSYDANGLRNERDLERADLLALGDSYVEAVETPLPQLFTTILACSTGQVVANLGLSGYGPQQEMATLRRYGVALRPEVVLWLFYEGNDLGDALLYEEFRGQLASGLRTRPSLAERLLARNLLDALVRVVRRAPPSPRAEERYGLFATEGGGSARIYFVDSCHTLTPRQEEGLAILERLLSEGFEIARRERFRLVLVYVPSKFRVLRDFVEFPPQAECLAWAPNDLPERLQSLVAGLSSARDFLDLTPALRAPAAEGRLTYLADDTHWTPLGHEVVVQAILRIL